MSRLISAYAKRFAARLLTIAGAGLVGFAPTENYATGTIGWVNLAGAVNPKWFGATGLGVVDDGPAWQAAVNFALSGSGIIAPSAGDYLFKTTVNIADLSSGLLVVGGNPNSVGKRVNLIQADINTPCFKVSGINVGFRGCAATVFAGAKVTAAGAPITVLSTTANTMTLSADPWPGVAPVVWAPENAYQSTDGTAYANAIRLNCFGAWIASGATKNGDNTVTLTGVKGASGTANAALAGTVGKAIEAFISLAMDVPDAALTNARAAIFDMDVRENQFFDNMWFNQCARAFAYDALGSGGGFNVGLGNAGFMSGIVADQVKQFLYAAGSVVGLQMSNSQFYGARKVFKVDGDFVDCNLSNVKFITCTKGFEITGSIRGSTITGGSVNALTGQGYTNGFMTCASLVDSTISGVTWGRSTNGTAPIVTGTADGFCLTGNNIQSHNEGGAGGFLSVTGASFTRSKVAGNNWAGRFVSSSLRVVFTNTAADITGTVFGPDVAAYTNHTAVGRIPVAAFSGTWANVAAGTLTVGYWKDEAGIVALSGVIGGGAMGTAAFTLPAGYRPSATVRMPIVATNAFGWVEITAAGVVTISSGAASTWVGLDGIRFHAA